MRRFATAAAGIALLAAGSTGFAQTVYPIDRAEILAGTTFDFKVEFPGLADPAKVSILINGEDHAKAFGNAASFIAREDGKDQSALILRDVSLTQPGDYKIRVTDGVLSREITWNVYATGQRKAKNVILFIGDGMSPAHRIAARMLAKGVAEGKALGKLAMDDMPHMALVATAGSDSIITDSANSASAYATGHKTAVNAMGVYADRTLDPLDDPKVETITSLVKRRLGMAVGIVTNTEIEDATPAAMLAHVRRRSEYDRIVEQYFAGKPDVLMGGGKANFLPRGADGSKRKDEVDFLARFREAGYSIALTGPEVAAAAADPGTRKLLGLFALGNMDGVLDRKFLKGGTVQKFPEQPDLTEQVSAALAVLSKNESGFFLMVESGMIDKYTHLLDMERAVYDTIMLDNAVRLARDWASARGDDTLILVVADHNHPIGLVGTIDDDMSKEAPAAMRERVRVYERAGFPNYGTPDAEGYPSRVDVSRRLALFSASLPDHYETYRPKLDNPNDPTVAGKDPGTYVANERYKSIPGAVFRFGNLPAMINADVHSGEDVILTATGPGSDRVRGQMTTRTCSESWSKRWGSARQLEQIRRKRQPLRRAGDARLVAAFVRRRSFSAWSWLPATRQAAGRLRRSRNVALAAAIWLWGVQAMAADGLITMRSSHGPKDTMNRLEAEVKAKGMTVFARIDHAAGAAEVGLPLRPTELLIFGNAKGGTPLMQAEQAIGIDLPLKALVWHDAVGTTWLSYNDPTWIAKRHGLSAATEAAVRGMAGALDGLARAAVGSP